MSDRIVYCLVTKPGGVDGKDAEDKGGKTMFASFNKDEVEKKVNGWHRMTSQVVDIEERQKLALSRLSPLDKLVLGLGRYQE